MSGAGGTATTATGGAGTGGGGGGSGGGGGGGPPPAGAAVAAAAAPPPPAVFLTSPWQGVIDLSTKTGKSLWDEGIRPLEDKFTGMAKDVVRFLAGVSNRATKCNWTDILTFGTRNLLTQYGEIPLQDVTAARIQRDALVPTSLAEARPKINASMMYHFVYESLGLVPQKKMSTKLTQINNDGPTLLKLVLMSTFIATIASTFTIKEKFYDLNLKRYRGNVVALNQEVREKLLDLTAAGHTADQTDILIALFHAYNTALNEEFKNSVSYWKNEWNSGIITTAEELMAKADDKFNELKDLGSWSKRPIKEDQMIALQAKIDKLTKKNKGGESDDNKDKSTTPQWKYDRSLSKTETYERNGKTYKWCKGPGHQGKPMWVRHEPGSCKKNYDSNASKNKSEKDDTNKKVSFDQKALAAYLKDKGVSDEEVESKMEAILAVISE